MNKTKNSISQMSEKRQVRKLSGGWGGGGGLIDYVVVNFLSQVIYIFICFNFI